MKIELDITEDGSFTEMGITQLLSVPYANFAFSGIEGKSAYEVWLSLGFSGSEEDFISSLKGEQGDTGEKGEKGEQGISLLWLGSRDNYPETPDLNHAFYHIELGISYIFDGSNWQILVKDGHDGAQGPEGPTGETGEQGIQGIPGVSLNWRGSFATHPTEEFNYAYYNTSDGTSYIFDGSIWQVLVKDGIDGQTGVGIQSIVDNDDGTFTFNYSDGTSFITSNLTGEKGEAGVPGEQGDPGPSGEPGADGKTILSGIEIPSLNIGAIGDFYLNTSTNFLFGPKTENGWGSGTSLVGPEGPQGISGTSSWDDQETIVSTTKKVGVGTDTPEGMFEVKSDGTSAEGAPLFEVKNSKGETIFAVYENSVKIYIDEESDPKTRGGFAISGRTSSKETREILTVDPVETRIYVDESTEKTRGGFAVSGRTTSKEDGAEIFMVTPELTEIFVNNSAGLKTRGGFAVSGRTTSKTPLDILHITPDFTRVYVDEPAAKAIGGFAVTGRSATDGMAEDVLTITPSLTQIYVDNLGSKTRGGFAVSGRTSSKESDDILHITPNFTRVYVNETDAKSRGGFAVSGRTSSKEDQGEIFMVTPGLTEVFVEENTNSKTRGGFAISGRTSSKSDAVYDVLRVVPERTDVYIKPSASKNALPQGFSITGLNQEFFQTELFSVSDGGTFVATTIAVAPKLNTNSVSSTTQTSAICGGNVLDDGGVAIITSGIVYLQKNLGLPTVQNIANVNASAGGVIYAEDKKSFPVLIMPNLKPETSYTVRAFAMNSDQLIGYGQTREFTTTSSTLLSMKVVDANSEPIENSVVTFWPLKSSKPIESGPAYYHEFNVPNGIHSYIVEAPGYLAESNENFEVTQNTGIAVALTSSYNPQVTFSIYNQNGNAVQGVEITITGEGSMETNKAGNAIFYLAPGVYDYTLTVPNGYIAHDGGLFEVTSEPNQLVKVTITEKPKVTFKVIYEGGAPAKYVNIVLTSQNHEDVIVQTDIYGIAIAYLEPDTWEYLVDGSASGKISVTNKDQSVGVVIFSETEVTLIVTDKYGKPINGAEISLLQSLREPIVIYTNSSGIALAKLFPGAWGYVVDAFNSSYVITTGKIDVLEGIQNQTFNIIMWEKSKVGFKVVDPDGKPVGSADLYLHLTTFPFDEYYLQTDQYGGAVAFLSPGAWEYSASDSLGNFAVATGTFTVVFGQDQTVAVAMSEPQKYSIIFEVIDLNKSNPIEGAEVSLMKANKKDAKVTNYYSETLYTSTDGTAIFKEVPEGIDYYYMVYHKDFVGTDDYIIIDNDKTVTVTLEPIAKDKAK